MQSAREAARAKSEKAAALQEQLAAVQTRLQEAHAAKEASATPSKEVRQLLLPCERCLFYLEAFVCIQVLPLVFHPANTVPEQCAFREF